MKKNEPITWEPKLVKLSDLKENPSNPKIESYIGKARLQKSLDKFGLAGTIVANKDLSIIDGHSRKKDLLEQGIEEAWVSLPSRLLTEKEYKEFNAMFDVAKAGDPDVMMMEEILGEDTMDEWSFDKKEKPKIREAELVPYTKTHVLLSFPPDKMIELQPLLQEISNKPYVEYEQANN